MTRYSKFNIVYWLQKWMDSVPGQTFLNYAYSWGASIVILGTLFKLTHLEGANLMLFIGMGTEVFVFFLSAFDRPFDKTADGMDLKTHYEVDGQNVQQGVVLGPGEQAPVVVEGELGEPGETIEGGDELSEGSQVAAAYGGGVVGGAPVGGVVGGGIVGGAPVGGVVGGTQAGGVVGGVGGGTIIIGGGGAPAEGTVQTVEGQVVEGAEGAEGVEGAEGEQTLSPTQVQMGGMQPAAVSTAWVGQQQQVSPEMAEATENYVEELKKLTEMLGKVNEQSIRLTRDSEEMENLNRTLTGICKVYEMQLKGASQQIGTIDQINEQSKKMANQIEQLNKIYARMIEAMTVNMRTAAPSQAPGIDQ